jgi:hypothetical protein
VRLQHLERCPAHLWIELIDVTRHEQRHHELSVGTCHVTLDTSG